jgi:hypothetical protein
MVFVLLIATSVSRAAPEDKVLAAIDAVLAHTPTARRDVDTGAPCSAHAGIPGEAFWCADDRTRLLGRWKLSGLTSDNPALSDVTVEIRAFVSDEAATLVKDIALERLGGGAIGPQEGCFTMCYEDAIWTKTLFVTLSYGCSASLKSTTDLRTAVFQMGVAHRGVAIGMRGFHSGSCRLLSPELHDAELWDVPDERFDPLPDSARFHHFARVTGINVTGEASTHDLSPALSLDHLERTAGCLPLIVWGPNERSWLVRVQGTDVRVPAQYLELQDASECRSQHHGSPASRDD